MNIVLLGPPGSGKGTQADMLTKRYQLVYISTGNILRQAMHARTALGIQAEAQIKVGQLASDDIVSGLVGERLRTAAAETGGFLFDGYPRNENQVYQFDAILAEQQLALSHVISLDVSEQTLLQRLLGRRTCDGCGRTVNIGLQKAGNKQFCQVCGGELIQRVDDDEATVQKRLSVYQSETRPVLTIYGKRGLLRTVRGDGKVEDVFQRLVSLLSDVLGSDSEG
jgi:adenylate kinase